MEDEHKLAYTVAETAVLTNQCRDLIYDAIRNGKLDARKAGRKTLILRASLEHYLNELPSLELARTRSVEGSSP